MSSRSFAVLVALWLALAPAFGALAQAADNPCESMSTSAPAEDCCGESMDAATCLSACLPAPVVMVSLCVPVPSGQVVAEMLLTAVPRYVGASSPPDIAPPKALVS